MTATVTMTARASLIAAALCAAVTAPQPALADETRRLAVIIGNNRGTGARPPLRYAEDDAEELARVLRELGGFKSGDVVLLRGGSLADVERAMAAVGSTLAVARAQGQRAVLLFYFSGHSDGEALEVGVERWSFADVRRKLKEQAADIRLVIVDSCRSGALLAAKGGTPGPAFDIRFTDDLATSGEAVLTSSAPHEVALESREIRASFFSHHLISGLRGAADSSGDGRVTLGEAYRYAFVNTLLSTSNTLTGPQHPAYDYRLAGRGELVLTDVTVSGARLTLPAELSRVLIVDGGRRRLVAELTDLSIRRIALPGGRYIIQGQREGRAYEMVVVLANGEARRLALSEFKPSVGSPVSSKGDEIAVTAAPAPWVVAASAGATRGAADALPWLPAARLDVRRGLRSGWLLQLGLARGRTAAFSETAVALAGGPWAGSARGRLSGHAGWRVAAGSIVQDVAGGERFSAWMFGTGPWLRGGIGLTPALAISATVGVDGVLLRRDGRNELVLWPAFLAGVELQL